VAIEFLMVARRGKNCYKQKAQDYNKKLSESQNDEKIPTNCLSNQSTVCECSWNFCRTPRLSQIKLLRHGWETTKSQVKRKPYRGIKLKCIASGDDKGYGGFMARVRRQLSIVRDGNLKENENVLLCIQHSCFPLFLLFKTLEINLMTRLSAGDKNL
jgi:hypothetical protein